MTTPTTPPQKNTDAGAYFIMGWLIAGLLCALAIGLYGYSCNRDYYKMQNFIEHNFCPNNTEFFNTKYIDNTTITCGKHMKEKINETSYILKSKPILVYIKKYLNTEDLT